MITLFDTSIRNIKTYISQRELLENYIGKIKPMCSPFREDKNPTITFKDTGDAIIWRDWKTGEYGDAFDFVAKIEGVDVKDLGKILYQKFKHGFNKIPVNHQYKKTSNVDRKYYVGTRDFTEENLVFWDKYQIGQDVLNHFNVFAIEKLLIEGSSGKFFSKPIDPVHSYGYKFTNWKIYQPYSEQKWLFYGSVNEIEGWNQLPESGELLVITKSLKDVMVLYTHGIPAISFQGERNVPLPEIIEELKLRFKRIVLLYDNDQTGIESSDIIKNIYEFEETFIPIDLGKDVSDVTKVYGYEYTDTLLNTLI